MDSEQFPLRETAMRFAASGWHVFPVLPGRKQPAIRQWQRHATSNPDQIDRWWQRMPHHNIGIACGLSGLVVIDLDLPKPGEAPPKGWNRSGERTGAHVLATLARRANAMVEPTYTVQTPSGGWHLYYRAPRGSRLANTAGELGWLIDTRAHGGAIVAAGSVTPTGRYELIDEQSPVELPAWLHQALIPRPAVAASRSRDTAAMHPDRYIRAALDGEAKRVRMATTGTRNRDLYRAAVALGQLVAGDAVTEEHVRAVLENAAAEHIANGAYHSRQVAQTISSGLRAGARQPRNLAHRWGRSA